MGVVERHLRERCAHVLLHPRQRVGAVPHALGAHLCHTLDQVAPTPAADLQRERQRVEVEAEAALGTLRFRTPVVGDAADGAPPAARRRQRLEVTSQEHGLDGHAEPAGQFDKPPRERGERVHRNHVGAGCAPAGAGF